MSFPWAAGLALGDGRRIIGAGFLGEYSSGPGAG
jgi:hypothetical protein